MTKEELFNDMDSCLQHGNMSCFDKQLDKLFTFFNINEASILLAEFIYKRYTTFKEDSMAALLESAINKQPEIAQTNLPENPLFKFFFILGSVELYDCLMEVGVLPFLKTKSEDFTFDTLTELHLVAQELNDSFFPEYVKCIKGLDYNGAFSQDTNSNKLSINKEDYELLEDVIEKYNTIIGRRDILNKLDNM